MSVTQSRNVPRINGGSTCKVLHSEIVTTLAVGDLNVQSYRLIPSFPPWLQGIAASFSKYRWLTLKVVWRPTCPNNTSGSIHMGLVYDAFDRLPASVAEISSLQSYASGAIWCGQAGSVITSNPRARCPKDAVCTALDVDKLEKPYYSYRSSIGSSLVEIQQSVPATLVVATEGGVADSTAVVGHIHWSYEIECIEPVPATINS